MLMTPMTPKVMARPIAASSRTEPSESPYQTFWTLFHIVRLVWIAPIASCAVRLTPSGVPAGRLDSNASASWSPRWRMHADRFDLLGFAGVRLEQDDGGVGFDQRAPDGRDWSLS